MQTIIIKYKISNQISNSNSVTRIINVPVLSRIAECEIRRDNVFPVHYEQYIGYISNHT